MEERTIEQQTKQTMTTKQFFKFLKTLHWPKLILASALTLAVFQTLASLAVPLLTKGLVDSFSTASFTWGTVGVLVALFLIQAIAGGISYYLLAYIGETVVADLRGKLWHHVLRLPIPYYDETETGETMSRITQDTTVLKALVTDHLVSFITGMISIVGAVGILLYLDWKMTLIMLISVPVSLLIMVPLGRMMRKVARATQTEMAKFTGHLGRTLGEIRLVKAYRAEPIEEKKGTEAIQSLFQYGLKEARIQAVVSPLMMMTMMGMLIVIFGYGGAQVAQGNLSAGTLVAILFLLFQIMMPFGQLAHFFTALQKALGATERIQTILTLEDERAEGGNVAEHGDLAFDHVSFAYNEEKRILQDVSFVIPQGTIAAFVGPSGGGKTTTFSLIERFYEPTSGVVTYGGQPIDAMELKQWRSKIGYVSQESPLMNGTITDNIVYGFSEEIDKQAVIEAAKAANALEFIEKLPQGFDTFVGERGMKLSGGQRQRIAIARALLHDPDILLLDEATSNLDSGSEAHVQEALHHLMQGRTTLMIAHRLSTITHADQLIFIEDGQVSGRGTHEQLYASHEKYRAYAQGQGL
ncbi:ABC transporter ATP-binding protein [Savagea faecisuis]|uniref:ABC transporter ATP-binding protein n=1 Tax=Savagea faecisuis TaxID=1274803 RepID=A0ABW3GXV9_9BACL